ncbi:nucleotidyltransferase family protein [Pseudoxanthomonas sp. PXM04]|uniref:nucleotidyltransferase family protein n=1 Tax=Pseudoxanthomonas sp. PXM04 TaxID=2769297 RepID=UPI00177E8312|nr:nucleotidyltransferase family protein [Pseudoxanthomonas sp. PXM04]MBD9378897.1 nucleotidyltransferase family protein [Pseudoxanthomonas sp. PXM04]
MTSAHDAVVLAAGGSRRLGQPKQLLTREGETLVRRGVRLAMETAPRRLLVIVGGHAEAVSAAVRDLPADILFNPEWEEGLASSLRLAAATLASTRADSSSACLLLACDQPALEAAHLAALREGFIVRGCAATRHGEGRGVPAWVPAELLAQASSLRGDRGLRGLLAARADEHIALLDAPELARDIDTPDDLREARRRGWIDPVPDAMPDPSP